MAAHSEDLAKLSFEIREEFHGLHDYATSMERALHEQYEAFAARHEEMRKNLPDRWFDDIEEDPIEYLYSDLNEAWDRFQLKFAQTLRQTVFISAYSLLEQWLVRICEHFEQTRPDDLRLRDLGHKGIEQARTYLTRVVHAPFPNTGIHWQRITACAKLRNWLVHNGPRVGPVPKAAELEKTLAQIPGTSLYEGRIELASDMCVEFIETLKAFFNELFRGMQTPPPGDGGFGSGAAGK